MKFISCQSCNKKLLKIGHFDNLQVKCPRCKAMNNYQNATSVQSEVHETPTNGETRATSSQKVTQ